jgi:16S rRNA (uracil1498-N3)-methyltransferase
MIPTFIFKSDDLKDDTLKIHGPEAHHIAKVLRMTKGEMVRVIDGYGMSYICEIRSVSARTVTCGIIKTVKKGGEPKLDLALAIGLSSATKFDLVVEKGTEVGVSRFIPLITEQAKVKIQEQETLVRRMNRWRRLCEAAAKQSARSIIPMISPPMIYGEFVAAIIPEESVLFHPDAKKMTPGGILAGASAKRLTAIIGPESGFSSSEVEAAKNRNIPVFSLGDRILRTETAGIVVPALLIYGEADAKG